MALEPETNIDIAARMIASRDTFYGHAVWVGHRWIIGFDGPTEGPDEEPFLEGKTTTFERAVENLKKRLTAFRATAIAKAGLLAWSRLSTARQAVLIALTYDYGDCPIDLDDDHETTARRILNRAGDWSAKHAGRRKVEADAYMIDDFPKGNPK